MKCNEIFSLVFSAEVSYGLKQNLKPEQSFKGFLKVTALPSSLEAQFLELTDRAESVNILKIRLFLHLSFEMQIILVLFFL